MTWRPALPPKRKILSLLANISKKTKIEPFPLCTAPHENMGAVL